MRQTISIFIGLILMGCGDDSVRIEPQLTIRFTNAPKSAVDHNVSYIHTYRAESDSTEIITYKVIQLPAWMEHDEESNTLSGMPGWENREKSFSVRLFATDGIDTVIQNNSISVTFADIICDQDFGEPSDSPYILPFKRGVSSEIMQSYCNPTNSHNNTFAYDFVLEMGEDIIASRGGIAIEIQARFPDGNGVSGEENFVYIQHDDGSVIRYVHLMQNSVPFSEGTRVSQGQVIGKNGLSGGTPRPHLHFELFREFTWSDKRFALPINFKNAVGDLDNNNGLINGKVYRAR